MEKQKEIKQTSLLNNEPNVKNVKTVQRSSGRIKLGCYIDVKPGKNSGLKTEK